MAVGAVAPQFTFVRICVAVVALGRKTQVGALQIFPSGHWGILAGEVRRAMTALTGQPGMLALQWIAGLSVIESLPARFPVNDFETLSSMLHVAAHAILALPNGVSDPGMESSILLQPVKNFRVTAQALESAPPCCKRMARTALHDAIIGTVRFGQRAWRDLGVYRRCNSQKAGQRQYVARGDEASFKNTHYAFHGDNLGSAARSCHLNQAGDNEA